MQAHTLVENFRVDSSQLTNKQESFTSFTERACYHATFHGMKVLWLQFEFDPYSEAAHKLFFLARHPNMLLVLGYTTDPSGIIIEYQPNTLESPEVQRTLKSQQPGARFTNICTPLVSATAYLSSFDLNIGCLALNTIFASDDMSTFKILPPLSLLNPSVFTAKLIDLAAAPEVLVSGTPSSTSDVFSMAVLVHLLWGLPDLSSGLVERSVARRKNNRGIFFTEDFKITGVPDMLSECLHNALKVDSTQRPSPDVLVAVFNKTREQLPASPPANTSSYAPPAAPSYGGQSDLSHLLSGIASYPAYPSMKPQEMTPHYEPSMLGGSSFYPQVSSSHYAPSDPRDPRDPRLSHHLEPPHLDRHHRRPERPERDRRGKGDIIDKTGKFLMTPWETTILGWADARRRDHLFSGDKLDYKGFHNKTGSNRNHCIVIRNNLGYMFGCFVSVSFVSEGQRECLKPDPEAFIFSLKRGDDTSPVLLKAKPTAKVRVAFDRGIELTDGRFDDLIITRDNISVHDLGSNFVIDHSRLGGMDPRIWLTGSEAPTTFSRFDVYRFSR
ncbi:hypothetical protein P9112_010504 [Eukaryota sp. TZLM1-RC]